jgi:Tfp pilus assembly protein PilF
MNPHEPIPSKGRRWIFALSVLLLLAATCGAGYWAYDKIKTRQSKHLATLANEYLRKGNMTEAAMSLENALRLQPKNVEVLNAAFLTKDARAKFKPQT